MVRRALGWLLFVASVTWHLWWVLAPPDPGAGPMRRTEGRDFATYYYAAQVAVEGGDPWNPEALSAAARADGTRDEVHPFFYPPPALLLVAWAPALDLRAAFDAWYVAQELALVVAAALLALWWRPLGSAVPALVAAWVALCWAVPYGLAMGQINPVVLACVVGGLYAAEARRPWLGGALLGAACMVKMSPALFVAWWALHRRWRPVGAALAAAVGLSAASAAMVGPAAQLRFYTEVLPTFATGDYNGLAIRIGMFANHSLPNLADQLLPGDGRVLSAGARALSAGANLALVAGLAAAFRHPTSDPWRVTGQVGAVGVAALLIPVYTFEHHLVQAIPAGVAITAAVCAGRLGRGWAVCAVLGAVALAWPHPELRALARQFPALSWPLQELKTAGLLALLAGSVALATPGR